MSSEKLVNTFTIIFIIALSCAGILYLSLRMLH